MTKKIREADLLKPGVDPNSLGNSILRTDEQLIKELMKYGIDFETIINLSSDELLAILKEQNVPSEAVAIIKDTWNMNKKIEAARNQQELNMNLKEIPQQTWNKVITM